MINVELAESLLERLREHPEEHDQSLWGWKGKNVDGGCRTLMCAAGTVCFLTGADIIWEPQANGTMIADFIHSHTLPTHARDGKLEQTYIPHAARELLGLTQAQADDLFYNADNLEDVEQILLPLIEEAKRHAAENDPVRHQIFADHG